MALVQYVFVRTDIPTIKRGGLVAQACHACVAAIFVHRDSPDTREYLANLESMTKVVLRVSGDQCRELLAFLREADYGHHAWVEHPEETVTCVALRPYHREQCGALRHFIRDYKLY